MRFKTILLVAGCILASTALAQTPPEPSEPEEPDFAFVASGPYTQIKNSVQFIHQVSFATRRFPQSGGNPPRREDDLLFFLRTEYGLSDRWELDVITPGSGSRERLNGQTLSSNFGYADSILGVRYRLLTEDRAPFTFATGPQLVLPTGSVSRGTGSGSAGFAWDAAAAKDWGGPVFLYSSLNYSVLPSADDTTPGSTRQFTLHAFEWAVALGLRALEKPVGDATLRQGRGKHDLHAFLEAGGAWGHEVEPGVAVGFRQAKLSWVFSPGLRYGFLTARKTLVEIGVAFPIGLGPNGPKKGILVQFQFEKLFGQH